MAKPGTTPKDKAITDNFNAKKLGGLSKKDLNKAKAAAAKQKKAKQAAAAAAKAAKVAAARAAKAEADLEKSLEQDDAKSAYQMLQDMRYVYRKLKGKQKLATLMADDRQFLFMVKELMKIEGQQIAARIRAKEGPQGGGQQTVFVVLKGLEDGPVIELGKEDSEIDHKQIAQALTPEGSELG